MGGYFANDVGQAAVAQLHVVIITDLMQPVVGFMFTNANRFMLTTF